MQSNSSKEESQRRKKIGNFIIGLCVTGLIVSSVLKFAHIPKVVTQMASMGYAGPTFFLVASLELLSALLFLAPATRSIGLLFISSFLGGAIASHVATSQYFAVIPPSVFLSLCWLGAWLRYPDMLSFTHEEPVAAVSGSKRLANSF